MTSVQFNEIKSRLADWREERHLTYESQKKGFLGNVFEEVSEYFRAKDNYERIDSICDIAIFCFNAFDVNFDNFQEHIRKPCMQSYYDGKRLSDIYKDVYAEDSFMSIIYEILIISRKIIYKDFYDLEVIINRLMFYLKELAEYLGFDFFKSMIETIKEIESRTGHYDDKLGKFVKDLGAYTEDEAWALALKNDKNALLEFRPNELIGAPEDTWGFTNMYIKKWYKANYENCRIRG